MEQTLINDNKIYWVYGNTQALIIPLEQEIIRDGEEGRTEPYYPDAEAEVIVSLVSRFKSYNYTPVVNGNLLTIADDGTLPVGCYSVRVVVNNPDGTQLRSLWENQVVVTNDNVRTLQEWNEFKDQNPQARAAVFFFAKGDPFTYEDFTQEQLEGLRGPRGEQGPQGEPGKDGADGKDGKDGESGGMLFPTMRFDPETGVLVIRGLKQEVQRISYDEKTAELIIKL